MSDSARAAREFWYVYRAAYRRQAFDELRAAVEESKPAMAHRLVADQRQKLDGLAPSLRPDFRVFIMGVFNAGKSTFLNALLGKVAPTRATRCTRVLTLIRFGPTPRGVHHLPGGTEQRLESLQAIWQAVTAANDDENRRQDWFEVWLPAPLLRDLDCTIADTPGFDDLQRQDHEYCRRQLESADAILWLVIADQVGAKADRTELNAIPEGIPVIGVLTQRDKVEKTGQSIEPGLQEVKRHFGSWVPGDRWFAVSAKSVCDAPPEGREEAWRRSGLQAVVDELQAVLNSSAGGRAGKLRAKAHRVMTLWRQARDALDGRARHIEGQLARLDQGRERLIQAAARALEAQQSRLESDAERLIQDLQNRLAAAATALMATRFDPDFGDRVRDVAQIETVTLPSDAGEEAATRAVEAVLAEAAAVMGRPVTASVTGAGPVDLLVEVWRPLLPDDETDADTQSQLRALFEEARAAVGDRASTRAPKSLTWKGVASKIRRNWGQPPGLIDRAVRAVELFFGGLTDAQLFEEHVGKPLLDAAAERLQEQLDVAIRVAWLRLGAALSDLMGQLDQYFLSEWHGRRDAAETELASCRQASQRLSQLLTDLPQRLAPRRFDFTRLAQPCRARHGAQRKTRSHR